MRDEIKGTTAITDGVVGVPGSGPHDTPPAAAIAISDHLPPNTPGFDDVETLPANQSSHKTQARAPPQDERTYWHGLITEREAAEYLGLTPRWFQAKRQRGDGPIFVKISERCIRYRRIDLKAYSDRQLRSSTSDQGDVVVV